MTTENEGITDWKRTSESKRQISKPMPSIFDSYFWRNCDLQCDVRS
jgi:hypothetical protein